MEALGNNKIGVQNLILENLAGPIIFIGGLILMLLIVPWERIKALFWVGIIGGLLVALILVYLMQNVYHFWVFHQVDLVYIFQIPFFVSAGWIPAIIVFSHLLTQYKSLVLIGIATLAFPTAATLIHILLIANKMLTYHNWNLVLTFLISLVIHIGIVGYLYVTGRFEPHQNRIIN
jgi:hypothetical protein